MKYLCICFIICLVGSTYSIAQNRLSSHYPKVQKKTFLAEKLDYSKLIQNYSNDYKINRINSSRANNVYLRELSNTSYQNIIRTTYETICMSLDHIPYRYSYFLLTEPISFDPLNMSKRSKKIANDESMMNGLLPYTP